MTIGLTSCLQFALQGHIWKLLKNIWQIKTEVLKDHYDGQANEIEGKPKFWVLVSLIVRPISALTVHMASTLLESEWARVTSRTLRCTLKRTCLLCRGELLVVQIRPLNSFSFQWKQNGQWRYVESHLSKPMGVQWHVIQWMKAQS